MDVQKTVRVAGAESAFADTASAPESSATFEYQVVVWNKSAEAVLGVVEAGSSVDQQRGGGHGECPGQQRDHGVALWRHEPW